MSLSETERRRRGLFGWLRSLLALEEGEERDEWEDKIQAIVFRIKEQQSRLDELAFRMEQRAAELFEKTVEHLKKARGPSLAEDEKKVHYNLAKTCAEEIYEIRRFLKAVRFTSISLERAAMRLQTVRDIKDFRSVLGPIAVLLANVKDEISPIFPSIAQALDEINKSIYELMAHTSAGMRGLPSGFLKSDEDVDKILSEAWAAANESVERNVPEPSKLLGLDQKPIKKDEKSSRAALEVSLTSSPKPPALSGEKLETGVEAARSLSASANASAGNLEEVLLNEIKTCGGKLNLDECSRKYGVPKEKLLEALSSLERKGKIKIVEKAQR
ncbi:MAG: hypothetical protein QXU97_00815 [Fervidicoccaceae archaeon]